MLLAREATPKAGVGAAVSKLAGLQAQLPRPPFLGLWSRLEGFTRASLAGAIAAREVVRVTSMRGTLHLMTTRDYVSIRGALQAMLTKGMEGALRGRMDGLDVPSVVRDARAFFDEEPRTFEELRTRLEALHPAANERALGHAARMHVPLVMVPTETRWSYAPTTDWAVAESYLGVPVATAASPAASEALVTMYLAAFGPASVRDAQAWSGVANLAPTFEALRTKLVTFHDGKKRELFDLPKAPRPDEETPAPVRFLPEFDNLLLAYADRARVVDAAHAKAISPTSTQVRPTFLVDGDVAGTWRLERARKTATVTLTRFSTLAKKTRTALEGEALTLAHFVEGDDVTCEVAFDDA